MTHQEYYAKRDFLQGVLKDAIERGDYHLELNCLAMLEKLQNEFNDDTPTHI
jgi:hypothetical protein